MDLNVVIGWKKL